MKVLVVLLLSLMASPLYAKMEVKDPPVKMGDKGSTWVTWIKDKGEKYDFEMVIKNESEKGMIVFLHDISCQRGAALGEVKHTFFNTGERTIDFKPGEMKKFNLVCDYGTEAKGDFTYKIAKVYENPNNDGKTTGKVIAKNVVWKTQEEKK